MPSEEALLLARALRFEAVTPAFALADYNRTSTVGYTDLDLTALTSSNAKLVLVHVRFRADVVGGGAMSYLMVRKNGETQPVISPFLHASCSVGAERDMTAWIFMDDDQIIEYSIVVGAGWQVDSFIEVHGYAEPVI